MLGDALGSVGVIISGLCVHFMPWDWKKYIDPSISVLIALIILKGTIPLVRFSARVRLDFDVCPLFVCLFVWILHLVLL